MYIRLFRERAFTLPWAEDWIWQIPVASQQIMTVILDVFRSGMSLRGAGGELYTQNDTILPRQAQDNHRNRLREKRYFIAGMSWEDPPDYDPGAKRNETKRNEKKKCFVLFILFLNLLTNKIVLAIN
jgi:hypothetical protein